ncbi:hypothetical protein MJD09_22160, partial [bacterium]|nr:hypothetical protein [bacterium]
KIYDLRLKQFDAEERDRSAHIEFLKRETVRLTQVSDNIAKECALKLTGDIDWAVEALEKAKLTPHAKTIFADRLDHFYEEKQHMATRFVPLLLRRCKHQIEVNNKKVYLLIDSGTTLYPFFENIGRESFNAYVNEDRWISNIFLATNNLPGVENIMQSGLQNPQNRFSDLVIKCQILPGEPLPVYSAITGEATVKAVHSLRKDVGDNAYFISLVTGNWVRIGQDYSSVCPIPLVRGAGHLPFKQALVDVADETYIVAPLGKNFLASNTNQINKALGFSDETKSPLQKPYKEVTVSQDKSQFVKLVSTSRLSHRALSALSTKLIAVLNIDDDDINRFPTAENNEIPHVLFSFDRLPDNWYYEIETEFPHPHTRIEKVMHKMFFVPEMSKSKH